MELYGHDQSLFFFAIIAFHSFCALLFCVYTKQVNSGGGGVLLEFRVGMCRPFLKILTLPQTKKMSFSCLVPRPHYSTRPKRFGSRGPIRSPRIRHRNELTERDWENAVQGLGKSFSIPIF